MKALRFSAMNRPTLSVRMMIASRIRPEMTVKTLKKPSMVSDRTAKPSSSAAKPMMPLRYRAQARRSSPGPAPPVSADGGNWVR